MRVPRYTITILNNERTPLLNPESNRVVRKLGNFTYGVGTILMIAGGIMEIHARDACLEQDRLCHDMEGIKVLGIGTVINIASCLMNMALRCKVRTRNRQFET